MNIYAIITAVIFYHNQEEDKISAFGYTILRCDWTKAAPRT